MSTRYTWHIVSSNLDESKSVGDANFDVIRTVNWHFQGYDGRNRGTVSGSTKFTVPAGDYVPLNRVTNSMILSWVKARVDENALKAEVDKIIAMQSRS